MIRKIIKINEEKCNGCGACAEACHEGAIGMVGGKARLMREDYCDGLGDCLPACPTGAITFEEREAPAYDHDAVMANKAKTEAEIKTQTDALANEEKTLTAGSSHLGGCAGTGGGCPGSMARSIMRSGSGGEKEQRESGCSSECHPHQSRLSQWPVQIKLAPVKAEYFNGADLLIAADCTAYAYGGFHERFIRNRKTLIGCPKLDEGDYSEKLTRIISENDIKSLTVVRMEVPCCGGIEAAAVKALKASGKFIPWQVITISTDGRILD